MTPVTLRAGRGRVWRVGPPSATAGASRSLWTAAAACTARRTARAQDARAQAAAPPRHSVSRQSTTWTIDALVEAQALRRAAGAPMRVMAWRPMRARLQRATGARGRPRTPAPERRARLVVAGGQVARDQRLVPREQVLEGRKRVGGHLEVGHLHLLKELAEQRPLQHQPARTAPGCVGAGAGRCARAAARAAPLRTLDCATCAAAGGLARRSSCSGVGGQVCAAAVAATRAAPGAVLRRAARGAAARAPHPARFSSRTQSRSMLPQLSAIAGLLYLRRRPAA